MMDTALQSAPPQPTPAAPRSRLRRFGVRLLRAVVISYLVACGLLWLAQSWIIFPGAHLRDRESSIVSPREGRELLTLRTEQGDQVAAVFGGALNADGSPRQDAAERPTILYFYGNGDCAKSSMRQFQHFRRLGANVLIPEYVGYPMSGGNASEAGLYATADAAYEYLQSRRDVNPNRIVIIGRSIGSGPAIDLASRKPVAALATFSAFTSMDDMSRKVLPMFPTSLFLQHHFRNDRKIAAVKCPVFLAHGTLDEFVPFAMMAKLAAAAGKPVVTVNVEGADHNSIFEIGGDPLMTKLGTLIDSVAAHPAVSTQ